MTTSGAQVASHPMDSGTRFRPSWTWPLVALALGWVGLLVLFRDTASAMGVIWYRSETFNHCFVVLPISAWLVWRKREMLAQIPPKPNPSLLLLVAAFALLWLLGDMVAVNSVTQLALVTLLVLTVPAILGIRVAFAISFPLAFLFFAVPIGEFLMPQLMEHTADFTIWALRLSGVPVLREGLQFVIPTGNWSVVEACSGVRYLIASLTVGTLFAYLNYQSTSRRLLFVVVSILVPIVANWLRAYMIVLLGHVSGNTLAVGVDHLIYGWVFFGVVVLLMFMIGARWSEPESMAAAPLVGSPVHVAPSAPLRFLVVAVLFICVAGLPEVVKWGLRHTQVAGVPVLSLPEALAPGWRREALPQVDYRPAFANASAESNGTYRSDAGAVGLYLAYYRNQDYERKLVSSANVLVASNDRQWARTRSGTALAGMGKEMLPVRAVEIRHLGTGLGSDGERIVAWQVYWIDGMPTSSDYLAKIYGAWRRLSGRGDESAVIVVYAKQSTTSNADDLLSEFLAKNYASIDSLLQKARGSP